MGLHLFFNFKDFVFAAWLIATALSCTAQNKKNTDAKSSVVLLSNQSVLQGVRDSKLGPSMVAGALAIVHTCMYDAWAAYDNKAIGTELGSTLRRPDHERKAENADKAISFAAYRAAVDLLSRDKPACSTCSWPGKRMNGSYRAVLSHFEIWSDNA